MKLIIQKTGVYNDVRRRAHRMQPGDVLDTGLEYGQSLIASGFAVDANQAAVETLHETSLQPSDNPRKGNEEDAAPEADPSEKTIDLNDGVDDGEATFASKTLSTRKRTKKA